MVADKIAMLKKTLTVSLVAITSVALLSGCTSTSKVDNVIKLSQNYEISSTPSWDESSVKELQKAGWDIQEQQETALREDNIALPQSFYATNKEKNCVVSFQSYVTNVRKPGAGEDYLTRDMGYTRSDGSEAKDFSEGTANIKIDGSDDKLEMLEIIYSFENKVAKPMTEEEAKAFQETPANSAGIAPDPGYTIDGMNEEAYLVRVTEATIPNPYYELIQNQTLTNSADSPTQKTGNAVLEVSYACQNGKIDKELWNKLKADAKITFAPLPTLLAAKK